MAEPIQRDFVIVPAAVVLAPFASTIVTTPSLPATVSVCVIETVVVPLPPLTVIPPLTKVPLFSVIVVVKLPLTVRGAVVAALRVSVD